MQLYILKVKLIGGWQEMRENWEIETIEFIYISYLNIKWLTIVISSSSKAKQFSLKQNHALIW